jgi:hypothetical protein
VCRSASSQRNMSMMLTKQPLRWQRYTKILQKRVKCANLQYRKEKRIF